MNRNELKKENKKLRKELSEIKRNNGFEFNLSNEEKSVKIEIKNENKSFYKKDTFWLSVTNIILSLVIAIITIFTAITRDNREKENRSLIYTTNRELHNTSKDYKIKAKKFEVLEDDEHTSKYANAFSNSTVEIDIKQGKVKSATLLTYREDLDYWYTRKIDDISGDKILVDPLKSIFNYTEYSYLEYSNTTNYMAYMDSYELNSYIESIDLKKCKTTYGNITLGKEISRYYFIYIESYDGSKFLDLIIETALIVDIEEDGDIIKYSLARPTERISSIDIIMNDNPEKSNGSFIFENVKTKELGGSYIQNISQEEAYDLFKKAYDKLNLEN
ncbi:MULTISPECIES: hypothetical protein [unclassified Breznakia]|uniref:hypothetical protein n=1 Tax=unclassified Breznakia TaxID=2623764 RepID=UPI00247380A4|nr:MULTISPECIES: hypothetical protein [unclassified Breznakia]MDH6366811.1 uncharacterized protein with FMN-binding domain [Breznakia sp. PH1-1]MDH6403989.1 uncharacterized protein with FMN-binding domain [Breznakia sp. PF1-11]MDH6411789.1 uncharacterized protein with FMN-binding domain [Breznakia sp. PFB1-11]MDH6413977.1 uncharacterized protein with FMN-binding domain [Breznakia sp. PFB1-14]MDH6416407.1 uncharacterized protein with FMN-binding domain [Breznakia sp. PFB1-4]